MKKKLDLWSLNEIFISKKAQNLKSIRLPSLNGKTAEKLFFLKVVDTMRNMFSHKAQQLTWFTVIQFAAQCSLDTHNLRRFSEYFLKDISTHICMRSFKLYEPEHIVLRIYLLLSFGLPRSDSTTTKFKI